MTIRVISNHLILVEAQGGGRQLRSPLIAPAHLFSTNNIRVISNHLTLVEAQREIMNVVTAVVVITSALSLILVSLSF